MARGTRQWRRAAHLLVTALALSVAVLAWLGFRAIREWQSSSMQLVQQRADEAAGILTAAISRDMQAVQQRVLSSADWAVDDPYSPNDLVASAFARYPYPDAFFAARGDLDPRQMVFFVRSDRVPSWVGPATAISRFPMTIVGDPVVAAAVIRATERAAAAGRSFATAELSIGGVPYQLVARLRYTGAFRDRLAGLLGVLVDLPWTRRTYFGEIAGEIARVDRMPPSTGYIIRDETGAMVSASGPMADGALRSRRQLPLLFFDPLLSPVGDESAVPRRTWTVEAMVTPDARLAAAVAGADRTAVIAGVASVALAFGLIMIARLVGAMEQVSALRAEFVAMVTHELKTPIANIRAMGDTLVSGRVSAPPERQEYARLVVQEAKRLTRLVDNLLALARITDVTEVYSFERLELEPLIERVFEDFAHALRSGGFAVAVEMPPDLPPIRGDRTAVALMLDNVVDNAIRYSLHERAITVQARQEGEMVALTIADRGIGIAADEIERIVQKFVRGRGQQSRGSGLGLAIVNRVIRDHGGTLRLVSAPGVGTTVHLTFPVAAAS